jgi:hypothetical protein
VDKKIAGKRWVFLDSAVQLSSIALVISHPVNSDIRTATRQRDSGQLLNASLTEAQSCRSMSKLLRAIYVIFYLKFF